MSKNAQHSAGSRKPAPDWSHQLDPDGTMDVAEHVSASTDGTGDYTAGDGAFESPFVALAASRDAE